MDRVFVSSVMGGFELERAAVKSAIESVGLRASMAENAPASADPSRTALLGHVESADLVVLVLGARYGYIGSSGRSPTEDEFIYAVELGKPVLVFVQNDVEREPEQDAFIKRVQGTWEAGAFTAFFTSPSELGFAVVKAITSFREQMAGGDAVPAALDAARALAGRRERNGYGSGKPIRIALVPVGVSGLIDALVLDDAALADRAAAVLRRHALVPQSSGIDVSTSSSGIEISASPARGDWLGTSVTVTSDGAVAVQADAAGGGGFGGMVLSQPRVERFVAAASAVSQDLWALFPAGERVTRVAAALGAPECEHTAWSTSGQTGSSMGVPTLPGVVVAPQPPAVLRRAELGTETANRRLVVSLRRVFADFGAVQS